MFYLRRTTNTWIAHAKKILCCQALQSVAGVCRMLWQVHWQKHLEYNRVRSAMNGPERVLKRHSSEQTRSQANPSYRLKLPTNMQQLATQYSHQVISCLFELGMSNGFCKDLKWRERPALTELTLGSCGRARPNSHIRCCCWSAKLHIRADGRAARVNAKCYYCSKRNRQLARAVIGAFALGSCLFSTKRFPHTLASGATNINHCVIVTQNRAL